MHPERLWTSLVEIAAYIQLPPIGLVPSCSLGCNYTDQAGSQSAITSRPLFVATRPGLTTLVAVMMVPFSRVLGGAGGHWSGFPFTFVSCMTCGAGDLMEMCSTCQMFETKIRIFVAICSLLRYLSEVSGCGNQLLPLALHPCDHRSDQAAADYIVPIPHCLALRLCLLSRELEPTPARLVIVVL